jgi:hypothetical protein
LEVLGGEHSYLYTLDWRMGLSVKEGCPLEEHGLFIQSCAVLLGTRRNSFFRMGDAKAAELTKPRVSCPSP